MLGKLKKYIATALIVLVAFTGIAGELFTPEPAHAQAAVIVAESIPDKLAAFLNQVKDTLIAAGKVAVVRTMASVVQKVAYDSAVWLASGAKGQNPFAQTGKFGGYLTDLADNAAGTFFEQLGSDKLNLCHLPDIKTDLALKIGLRTSFGGAIPGVGTPGAAAAPAKPDCSLSQLVHNWGSEWNSKYGAQATVQRFNGLIQVDNSSDLGIQLQSSEQIANAVQQQVLGGTLQREEDKGYKPKTSLISDQIQTPASLIEEQFKANTPDKTAKSNADTLNQSLNSDQPSVWATALSIFLNTLVSTAVTNFQNRGVLPTDTGSTSGASATNANAQPTGGAQVAANFYRELQTVKIGEVTNYDVLSKLSSCTDSPGTYNCRANDNFVAGLKKAGTGEPETIAAALVNGDLSGSFLLIPPTAAKNKDRDCYTSAYCYGNIQVLRQLRILPLGFEIAAKNSDPDHPWNLQQVVSGFDDCQYIDPSDHSKGIVDDPTGHPFCHLIDPNWVLKVPPTQCKATEPGAVLAGTGVPNRLEDCMDVQSCVHYAADGTCDNYGYCAREQNLWKFAANTCDAYAATCRTFTNTATGQADSFLYRTVDTSFCSDKNVGCTAYSLDQQGGKWQDPKIRGADQDFTNSGIYFNSNVSDTCSANSEGCSALLIAGSATNDLLYLKKAPDYLKCYDANPATPQVDWPQSVADLNRMKPDAACKNYATVCTRDEVSCSLYTPSAGGQAIPGQYRPHEIVNGQIKWNDECSPACVGYDAYREMPSPYSNGQAVSYIIPASGATCSAADVGCTGFTNLSTTEGGLEKVEYFTKLRPCVTPDKDIGKTYVTYEGSRETGFQLKTYILVENKSTDADASANGPIGAPKYFYKDATELQNNLDDCNETRYKAGTASVDCRQFSDEKGNTYYRLLPFTIPVSLECTPYRLSNPELTDPVTMTAGDCTLQKGLFNSANNTCQLCLQNGEYRDGSCFYNGLPGGVQNSAGISQTCTETVDTCRAYKGTKGGIAGQVFEDTFDDTSTTIALAGWTGAVSLATESTHIGGQSLLIQSGEGIKTTTFDQNAQFDVTLWAKGTGGPVTMQLQRTDGTPETLGIITPGEAWNYYHLGPIEVNGAATSSAKILITSSSGGSVWVDDIALNHSTDLIYLVKKTLSVDAACDSHPSDNLPGEALGCTAYTDTNNKPVDLVNFSQLCREEAIGCTAILDTQNTVTVGSSGAYQAGDEGERAYNVWLSAPGGTTATTTIGTDTYSCPVPAGATGCYLNTPILNHSAADIQAAPRTSFVKSTIFISKDTPASTPIYLVANQAATCNRVDLGCTYAGVAQSTPTGVTYATTTIKNDPNGTGGYAKTLCQEQAVGCQAFTDSANSPYYFKDPNATGQKICTYRTDVPVNGNKVNGWFWKGVGVCSNDPSLLCEQSSETTDCGAGNTCQNIDDQPCYPNYFVNGDTYGLWSYGNTAAYKNFVGECKPEQDKCTEFVDHTYVSPTDPTKNVDQAYYLINDPAKLNSGDCSGNVSQKIGCALLDQTENPNKYWVRGLSYAASDQASAPVAPVTSPDSAHPNDSNVILKVIPDRECAEWLQCSHSFTVTDDTGKTKQVCQSLERCDAGSTSEDCGIGVKSAYTNQILTDSIYRDRSVTWAGKDYDGYSILGLYPLEELTQVNFSSSTANPDWRLVKTIPCGSGANSNCAVNASPTDDLCQGDGVCGGATRGLCVNGTCVKDINGGNDPASVGQAPTMTCRAYPETDSPFPSTKAVRTGPDFAQAHVCDEGAAGTSKFTGVPGSNACECNYTKVNYGDIITRYFDYVKPNSVVPIIPTAPGGSSQSGSAPAGICQGGDQDGYACATDSNCQTNATPAQTDGVCEKQKAARQYVGWSGFCLEPDKTRPINADANQFACLTWLPIDALVGAPDIYNQHTEAGFQNPSPTGGRLFCLKAAGSGLSPGMTRTPDSCFSGVTPDTIVAFSSSPPRAGNDGTCNYCGNVELDSCLPKQVSGGTGNLGSFDRGYYDSNIDEGVYLTDLEKISIGNVNGTTAVILPNDFTGKNNATFQLYYEPTSSDGSSSGIQIMVGHYLGRPNELLLLEAGGYDSGSDTSRIDLSTKALFTYQAGTLGLNGNPFAVDGLKAGTQLTTIWDNTSTDSLCPQDSAASGYKMWWAAFRLVFDPISGEFSRYYHAACVDQASLLDSKDFAYSVTFKEKEWCPLVADSTVLATDNDFTGPRTVAFTDRIWKQQGTIGFGYLFSTDYNLFGSLSINEITQPVFGQTILTPLDQIACPAGSTSCTTHLVVSQSQLPYLPNNVVGAPYTCSDTARSPGSCVRSLNTNPSVTRALYLDDPSILNTSGNLKQGAYDVGGAKEGLNQIFADFRNIWNWSTTTYSYVPNTQQETSATADATILNSTATGNYFSDTNEDHTPVPPQILAVGNCVNAEQCLEVPTTTAQSFTINDRYNKDIVVRSNSFKAAAKFFAYADKEQMPIRQITVDWDDGSTPTSLPTGFFRNQRGLNPPKCVLSTTVGQQGHCVDGTGATLSPAVGCFRDTDCPATPVCQTLPATTGAPTIDFDKIADKTCDTSYFEVDNGHYYCSTASHNYTDGKAGQCNNNQNVTFPNGCCIFKPRIQVKDNWGWCNGTCPDTPNSSFPNVPTVKHPNGGCYDDSWDKLNAGIDECNTKEQASLSHWTTFGGRIILAP